MDIGSQNEGKIYLPDHGNDGKIYVPQQNSLNTPSWSSTPQSPPSQVAGYYAAYAPYSNHPPPPDQSKERTICGLRKITFILSVIIAILVLALALGLGIGLGLDRDGQKAGQDGGNALGANQTNSAQPTTDAPTATTSTTATSVLSIDPTATVRQTVTSLPTVLDLDCPSPAEPSPTVKMLSQKGDTGTTFALNCGQDNSGFDILTTMAYSMDDCMRACLMYNHFSKPLRCVGVQFWRPIDQAKKIWDGNCFLKNGTVSKIENKDSGSTVWAKIV